MVYRRWFNEQKFPLPVQYTEEAKQKLPSVTRCMLELELMEIPRPGKNSQPARFKYYEMQTDDNIKEVVLASAFQDMQTNIFVVQG